MKETIEKLLKERRKTKKELFEFLNISPAGFHYKMLNDTFKMAEIDRIAEFLGVQHMEIIGEKPENTRKSDQYLQDYLKKIENEWKSIVAEKDNIIAEYKDIIKDLKQSRAAGQSNFLKPAPKTYWLDSKRMKQIQKASAVAGVRA